MRRATCYALARSGRESEARGPRFAKWLYRASCCKPSRRTHLMSHRKVVLVTGASSGFGKAIAGLLATRDLEVFGTSRHPSTNGAPRSLAFCANVARNVFKLKTTPLRRASSDLSHP